MNTNPDDWRLRRRHPPISPGDAWSGGGRAYREWMGAKPRPESPAHSNAPQGAVGRVARDWPPNPRAVRFVRIRWRLRSGRWLALGAAVLAAVVFLAPLAWAGRLDPCTATEVALVDEAIGREGGLAASKARVANWTGADGRLLSHGRVGREIAAREYAGWPAFAGCTALFWRARWEVASFGGVGVLRFAPAIARR